MSAGVHLAGYLAGKVHAGCLLHGQGVHIGAQQKGLAALPHRGGNARASAGLRGIAQLGQAAGDVLHGIVDIKPRAGVGVQGVAVGGDGSGVGAGFGQNLLVQHTKHLPLYSSIPRNRAAVNGYLLIFAG